MTLFLVEGSEFRRARRRARDQVISDLGAPTAPLAIRRPDDENTFSILMPVRLEN
ncbi:hypothetical protein [Streptomyces sp. NBC_00704]|uniref:hypothetical protein n=1 Tax=Streptomyces sp. NBC_00704 TaxID=2975809 RepID=UPI003FA7458C